MLILNSTANLTLLKTYTWRGKKIQGKKKEEETQGGKLSVLYWKKSSCCGPFPEKGWFGIDPQKGTTKKRDYLVGPPEKLDILTMAEEEFHLVFT